MKILMLLPYVPFPVDRGAYHRAFQLLKGLAEDHEVDLLAMAERGEGIEHRAVFEELCGRVEFVPFEHPRWQRLFPKRLLNRSPATIAHWSAPRVDERLDQMLAARRYDAIHVFDIVLAQYVLGKGIPFVLDRTRVDLQYQLMEARRMNRSVKNRLLGMENWSKLWFFERTVARKARFEVVCGPDDESFLRKFVKRDLNVVVIPNGVDIAYFNPDAASGQSRDVDPTVLFCGAMDYNPNIDALRWFFGEIHDGLVKEIPDLKTLIVGRDPGPEISGYGRRKGVTITGAVPDVRPYYRRAWAQIVPLRIGGGTRLKIVESIAMSTMVISTTIGAQGLDLRHGQEILLADDRESFIRESARALKDQELRRRLEETGLETVRARLSWPRLGKKLSEVYSARFNGR